MLKRGNRAAKPLAQANDQLATPLRVLPRKEHRGINLISDALPRGRLWYTETDDAIEYAKFRSRSHDAVIRINDYAVNGIETHEHAGEFKEW